MKRNRLVYLISTGLLTLLMLFSAAMYLFNYDEVATMFVAFGYPTYIIYPLAIAKLLGLLGIWNPRYNALKEWAYAGFFYDIVLAYFAHKMINDGQELGAIIALVLIIISYIYWRKIK